MKLKTLHEIFFIYEGKNLIAVKDKIGRVTRYEYEENLLRRVIYPDGTFEIFRYDENNRMIYKMTREGQELFWRYFKDFLKIHR